VTQDDAQILAHLPAQASLCGAAPVVLMIFSGLLENPPSPFTRYLMLS
jgi:hypothetical protein